MNSKIFFKASLSFIATPLVFLVAKLTFATSLNHQHGSKLEHTHNSRNTVLIDRIRVAIAGHDKDLFARYPAQGTPEISVQ
ncbi:hypothetical protein SD80_029480 [Scytonema tolypothrichoides VB-61278]|nr:hypothetical protein SD80_029480 [Scytonema tolypothrichoides VB-61278]